MLNTIENKTPNISNLATKAALNTNRKIKYLMLVILLKSDYDTKIKDIENKYITTTEFNKLASDAVNARIILAKFSKKTDFDNKLSDLNRKIVSNKTKDISLAKKIKLFSW